MEQELYDAFPLYPIPEDIEQVSIYPEDSHTAVIGFTGLRWDEIPYHVIDDTEFNESQFAFNYFSPEAYRYYIAAYMLYILSHKTYPDAFESVVNDLYRSPMVENWEKCFCERWYHFTLPQLEVIQRFMRELAKMPEASMIGSQAERVEVTLELLKIRLMLEQLSEEEG